MEYVFEEEYSESLSAESFTPWIKNVSLLIDKIIVDKTIKRRRVL